MPIENFLPSHRQPPLRRHPCRGPHAHSALQPGVDRLQRFRSRHHAGPAVRVDDRSAALPHESRPRAQLPEVPPTDRNRTAARAARDRGSHVPGQEHRRDVMGLRSRSARLSRRTTAPAAIPLFSKRHATSSPSKRRSPPFRCSTAIRSSTSPPSTSAGNQGFEPFGPAAAEGSALMLGFDLNDVFPEVEINLAVFAEEKQSPDDVHQLRHSAAISRSRRPRSRGNTGAAPAGARSRC